MIYLKANVPGAEIKVSFNGDNLYAKCKECGKEMKVSQELLAALITTGIDLKGAVTMCETCIDDLLMKEIGGRENVHGNRGNCCRSKDR